MPAIRAVVQQFWRLNPPVNPSTFIISPAKYNPLTNFDSIVLGLISFVSTPPAVTMPAPLTLSVMWIFSAVRFSNNNLCRYMTKIICFSFFVIWAICFVGSIPLFINIISNKLFGQNSLKEFLIDVLGLSVLKFST